MTKATGSVKSAQEMVLIVPQEQAKITWYVIFVIISWQRKQQSQNHGGVPQLSCYQSERGYRSHHSFT